MSLIYSYLLSIFSLVTLEKFGIIKKIFGEINPFSINAPLLGIEVEHWLKTD